MNVGQMFEMTEDGFVADIAREVGLVTYPTGGRALVSLPLISASAMDIFVGNEVTTILEFWFCNSSSEMVPSFNPQYCASILYCVCNVFLFTSSDNCDVIGRSELYVHQQCGWEWKLH